MTALLHNIPQILTCLLICGIEIIEMAIQSIRIIMQVKGRRLATALLAFAECLLWGLVISAIITTLADNLYCLLAYCIGFAVGIFLGSILEDKLALGETILQFIADEDDGNKITEYLVENGRGFTAFEGFGYDGKRFKINAVVPRKAERQIVADIHKMAPQVFVTGAGINIYSGGFGVRGDRK